jgi:hypothetical protein
LRSRSNFESREFSSIIRNIHCDRAPFSEVFAMPLHDWSDDRGWDNVHLLWLNQMLDWVQPRLPEGFRAYLGSVPALTIDTTNGRPDLSVRQWTPETATVGTGETSVAAPDQEAVATFSLDPQRAIHIDWHGQLISAIELVSPRNKDRPGARTRYLGRYISYLRQRVHLLLIDVLPRPRDFSFADTIADSLGIPHEPMPPPCAVSFRVGEALPEGTLIASWTRPMQIGQPLPVIPLALDTTQAVSIDLEQTYQQAAKRAYLA